MRIFQDEGKDMLRKIRRLMRLGQPNFATLGLGYEDSQRIMAAKSSWMVMWLRARRDGDQLRGYYRRKHFEQVAAA
jgi:hypothetical protein